MDISTLERLSEFICGDNSDLSPVYRTGSDLTRFFHRVGLKRFTHDGATRKWWTLDCLRSCNGKELSLILKRLASPKEYSGDKAKVKHALKSLNEIFYIEGLKVELKGIVPVIKKVSPNYNIKENNDEERELKPLPPPNFSSIDIEPVIANILVKRWEEAENVLMLELIYLQ